MFHQPLKIKSFVLFLFSYSLPEDSICCFTESWCIIIIFIIIIMSLSRTDFSGEHIQWNRSEKANGDPVSVSLEHGPQKSRGSFMSTHESGQDASALPHRTVPHPPGRKDLYAEAQWLRRHLQGRSLRSDSSPESAVCCDVNSWSKTHQPLNNISSLWLFRCSVCPHVITYI